jgi:hypothetical protein
VSEGETEVDLVTETEGDVLRETVGENVDVAQDEDDGEILADADTDAELLWLREAEVVMVAEAHEVLETEGDRDDVTLPDELFEGEVDGVDEPLPEEDTLMEGDKVSVVEPEREPEVDTDAVFE